MTLGSGSGFTDIEESDKNNNSVNLEFDVQANFSSVPDTFSELAQRDTCFGNSQNSIQLFTSMSLFPS